MSNSLLIDYMPFQFTKEAINESINRNDGKLIVRGVLQRAEVRNQNGRSYPRAILEREITSYRDTKIQNKRALGELDHPESSVVNLKNVSHNITQIDWNGDDVVGTVEILNTPSGNILKELFKAGIELGISSRGMGSVRQIDESTSEVQEDFQLVGWDFVSDPSTQGAFMKPVNESKQYNKLNEHNTEAHALIHAIICELSGVCCLK